MSAISVKGQSVLHPDVVFRIAGYRGKLILRKTVDFLLFFFHLNNKINVFLFPNHFQAAIKMDEEKVFTHRGGKIINQLK